MVFVPLNLCRPIYLFLYFAIFLLKQNFRSNGAMDLLELDPEKQNHFLTIVNYKLFAIYFVWFIEL